MLSEKSRPSYNASYLCSAIKDCEDNPISIYEQRDVSEFFNLFLEKIDECLISNKMLSKDIFGGTLANEILCLECPHKSDKKEEFLSLNLQIKGKKNLQESLKQFIESESLEGNNLYYCEICDKKIKAKKRVTVKVLPNNLCISLKRFDYDRETGYFS